MRCEWYITWVTWLIEANYCYPFVPFNLLTTKCESKMKDQTLILYFLQANMFMAVGLIDPILAHSM